MGGAGADRRRCGWRAAPLRADPRLARASARRPRGGQRVGARDDPGDIGLRRRAALELHRSAPAARLRPRASTVTIGGERVSVLSSSRFNRFSLAQANSLSSRAPTMRPLPLRVWNERRSVTSTSCSSGFCSQAGNCLAILASSSRASSMKSCTSSGSAASIRRLRGHAAVPASARLRRCRDGRFDATRRAAM